MEKRGKTLARGVFSDDEFAGGPLSHCHLLGEIPNMYNLFISRTVQIYTLFIF